MKTWMTPEEYTKWRTKLRDDYARMIPRVRRVHTALGFGIANGDDFATPAALAVLA